MARIALMSSTSTSPSRVVTAVTGAPWRLYAINGLFFAVSAMLTPVYPFLVMQAGGNAVHHQLMSMACYAAQVCALLAAARLLSRQQHSRSHMTAAMLAFAGALTAGSLARSLPALWIVRIAEGFTSGLFAPAAALAVSARTRLGLGETFGQLSGVRNIARVGAPAIGGLVAVLTGQWTMLLIGAVICCSLTLVLRPEDDAIPPTAAPAPAPRAPSPLRLSLVRGFTATAQGLLQPLFPFVAARELGFTPLAVGLTYSLAGVLSFFIPAYLGRVADRSGVAGPVLALAGFATVSLLVLGHSTSAVSIVPAFCLGFAVLVAATSLSQAAMVSQFAAAQRGSGFARIEVAAAVGRIVGPALGALIYPAAGWSAACDVAAGIAVATAAVMWVGTNEPEGH
jgi:MFS family permease